jgi:hypothetical protein
MTAGDDGTSLPQVTAPREGAPVEKLEKFSVEWLVRRLEEAQQSLKGKEAELALAQQRLELQATQHGELRVEIEAVDRERQRQQAPLPPVQIGHVSSLAPY